MPFRLLAFPRAQERAAKYMITSFTSTIKFIKMKKDMASFESNILYVIIYSKCAMIALNQKAKIESIY